MKTVDERRRNLTIVAPEEWHRAHMRHRLSDIYDDTCEFCLLDREEAEDKQEQEEE